jgi:hypothetical protein
MYNYGQNDAVAIGMIIGMVIGALIGIGLLVLLVVFLNNTFKRIPAKHRQMEPGQVFLLLIPCFGNVWMFFVYQKRKRDVLTWAIVEKTLV